MNCTVQEHKHSRPPHLLEGKSYGTRLSFSDEKSMLMNTLIQLVGSLKGNLDQKLIDDSLSAYDDLKAEFRDALMGLLQSYQNEEITIAQLEKQLRKEIRDAWSQAYEYGVGSVGNPFGVYDEDASWLKGATAEEHGYLGGFMDDLKSEEFVMDPETRMGMYADALDGVFNHGQVEGSPDNVVISWNLGDSEHCPDCIELAANSPYTKDNLPSVPGDGSTVCKSNCQCSLSFEHTGEMPGREPMKISVPGAPRVPEGYRLPSFAEHEKLSAWDTERERLSGMISVSSGDRKKEYIYARKDITANIIDYAEKNNIYFVRGSNYWQGGDASVFEQSLEFARKPSLPEGYRFPSEPEKKRIDSLILKVNDLRQRISRERNGSAKELISQRYKVNQEILEYMERHKIYYIPAGLVGSPDEFRRILTESLGLELTRRLFG